MMFTHRKSWIHYEAILEKERKSQQMWSSRKSSCILTEISSETGKNLARKKSTKYKKYKTACLK
jgi:hypothetical protein